MGEKMGRFTQKRNRIARRFGINIFGRSRNPLIHKSNPPGVHGARRRKKSDYGLQLEEKQKLKAIYGLLSEKQLVNYYKKASAMKGNTAHILAAMLECRLDNMVYRLGFASTIFSAHQLVAHGNVLVNGKRVDIRSFQVKPGMKISLSEKAARTKVVIRSLENKSRSVPEYLTLESEKCTGELIAIPDVEQMPWPIEVNLAEICDFLAHTT
jgi:small subunit ribosomal protein S4